jgi:ligand-binding sensor domain-containing protein
VQRVGGVENSKRIFELKEPHQHIEIDSSRQKALFLKNGWKMKENFDVQFLMFEISNRSFKKYVFIVGLLFFFLEFRNFGFAQKPQTPFIFKQFKDGNGTQTNIVSCFLEDTDGFLWVGTADGLKRFDGTDFTIFKNEKDNPNSLAHNEIEALCEDNSGKIWIGSGQGISYFDKKLNKFFNLKEFNKSNHICFNIVCNNQGDVWFSIRKLGLFHYSVITKKIENLSNKTDNIHALSSKRIFQKGMILDPLKRGIWLQTEKGVNFYEFSSKQFFNKKNNPKKLPIFQNENTRGLAIDSNNLIFFDIDHQKLSYYDIKEGMISKEYLVKNAKNARKIEILYIFVDNKHNIWLSDWFRFCYYFDIKTQKTIELINDDSNPNSISSNSFWCTYQQKDGTIWLGTNNGISFTNSHKGFYQFYDLSELYPPLKVRNQLYALAEDKIDKSWWLAVDTQSFVHYHPETNQLETFDIPVNLKTPDQYIITLADIQNKIYAVLTSSFYVFDKTKMTLKKINLPDSLNFKNLISHAIQKGDSIWFFCKNAKAYSFKIQSQKWKEYPILTVLKPDESSTYPFLTNTHQTPKNSTLINTTSNIYCSEVDNAGDIWIAIQNTGLAKFSRKKQAFELIKAKNEVDFNNLSYTGMRKDKDGNFWIGTYGLLKFNPISKEFSSVINATVINDLIIDDEGKVWTAAYNDFTILYPKTNKIIKQTIPLNKGNLLWINSLYTLSDGKIASLMRGVIAVIDPTKLVSGYTKDRVLITKVLFANSEILLHHNESFLELATNKNAFSIHVSTLNSPNENKYRYLYKFSGLEKEWNDSPYSAISFSNLEGGDYEFSVKGVDNNGYETPISTLKIQIDTVFYKSKWFLYLCLLIICGLIFAFVKFRANQNAKIIHLEMQSTRLEKDKTEIQYQNLINHLNPHFLFNSLTSLNSLIMTEPKEASKFLQKLSLIYRYILQNKDKEIISLAQELAFVKHYVELQKSRFEAGLQINIDINKTYMNAGIVPVTLQNLFENAIKHNSLEEDKPLIISVVVDGAYLIVKNNLQKKKYVQTSNKQGLVSLRGLYKYLSKNAFSITETNDEFIVKIPLL